MVSSSPREAVRTTWMKTTQQDLKSMNLPLNEPIDVAQHRPLYRLMSRLALHTYSMPEMNESMRTGRVRMHFS